MNREFIFRGKRLDNNEWAYGDLVHDNYGGSYIYPNDCEGLYSENKVYVDTVGQFTGVLDKNDKMIFEGDIVRKRDLTFKTELVGVIMYNSFIGCFSIHSEQNGITTRSGFEMSDVFDDGKCTVPVKYDYEVIGNIYDNKDLLKGTLKKKYKYC